MESKGEENKAKTTIVNVEKKYNTKTPTGTGMMIGAFGAAGKKIKFVEKKKNEEGGCKTTTTIPIDGKEYHPTPTGSNLLLGAAAMYSMKKKDPCEKSKD